MLELKEIVKEYVMGEEKVTALGGVTISFRESEFVAVLGHSGCGKTTLLNIVGGLDRSTSGDLIINGRSTKKFKDRSWDSYRNHSIGFVFQSYNLIPHQTVLQNVILALSLSGVSKAEQRERAVAALEKVGLGNQLKKKPSELSGGQMQRVAIARAIVNDPDIILADEPTGALDSETSIQVMDILKEISKDRLVIMVTHNPELAEQYATRIVRMSDGKVVGDSQPMTEEEIQAAYDAQAARGRTRVKRPSMSFATSFGLSLMNLFTKKGRTILTAFAGSIGIIGIALIFAVSQGMTDYIDSVQEDTLSTYPLSITAETADMSSMITAFSNATADDGPSEDGVITERQFMADMFAQVGSNDLKAFKQYLEENMDEVEGDINAIKYDYNIAPNIYTIDVNNKLKQINPSSLLSSMMVSSISLVYSNIGVFSEMIDDRALLDEQYDMIAGKWPENYNELVLVLSSGSGLSDFTAYAIGIKDEKELSEMFNAVMKGEEVTGISEPITWSYDDILSMTFKVINASDKYKYNSEYKVWEDMSGDNDYMMNLYNNGEELKVVGIVCPKPGVSASALNLGFNYTSELTAHVMERAAEAEIVKQQKENKEIDVFSGRKFEDITSNSSNGNLNFEDMITVDQEAMSQAFGLKLTESDIEKLIQGYITDINKDLTADTAPAEEAFLSTMKTLISGMLRGYLSSNGGSTAVIYSSNVNKIVSDYIARSDVQAMFTSLEKQYVIPADTFKDTYAQILNGVLVAYIQAMGDSSTSASISSEIIDMMVAALDSTEELSDAVKAMGTAMTEARMKSRVLTAVGEMSQELAATFTDFDVDAEKLAAAFKFNLTEEELSRLISSYSANSDTTTADSNLRDLGYSDPDEPYSISIYLKDFTAKEEFIDFIDEYNESMEDEGKDEMVITYTDITGVLMSSVKTVVDSVTYVLIAFVAISLIVSSIMIGVITLISVQERTKEIGILRALGASKKNVSSMFNAETTIIGLVSGVLGVVVTYLLCIPIDAILFALTGIEKLHTHLPIFVAIILVIISVILTLIAGIIPSKSAAKKDPVVALRTE